MFELAGELTYVWASSPGEHTRAGCELAGELTRVRVELARRAHPCRVELAGECLLYGFCSFVNFRFFSFNECFAENPRL